MLDLATTKRELALGDNTLYINVPPNAVVQLNYSEDDNSECSMHIEGIVQAEMMYMYVNMFHLALKATGLDVEELEIYSGELTYARVPLCLELMPTVQGSPLDDPIEKNLEFYSSTKITAFVHGIVEQLAAVK